MPMKQWSVCAGASEPPLPIPVLLRFEVDALRSQLLSLQTEATRVQHANQLLQAELRERGTADATVEAMKREGAAFQVWPRGVGWECWKEKGSSIPE